MLRYAVAACAIVVSGFVLHAIAAEEPAAAANRFVLTANAEGPEAERQEIAELKDQIGRLQTGLDRLKERLETLEEAHQLRILTVPAPAPRPLANPIPPDWQRREFNGQEYFIIPLAKDPATP